MKDYNTPPLGSAQPTETTDGEPTAPRFNAQVFTVPPGWYLRLRGRPWAGKTASDPPPATTATTPSPRSNNVERFRLLVAGIIAGLVLVLVLAFTTRRPRPAGSASAPVATSPSAAQPTEALPLDDDFAVDLSLDDEVLPLASASAAPASAAPRTGARQNPRPASSNHKSWLEPDGLIF